MLAETVEELLRGLEAFDREILILQLQGCTIPEISTQVTRAERTVRRAIERIRKRLRRLQTETVN